jgi:ABC-type multidrug transport system ATPase subunit
MKSSSAIILTTHSMEEADALCDRIGILSKGRLQALGSSSRLKAVYGCGFQVATTCESQSEEFNAHFLHSQPANEWEICRQIGSHTVFQRTNTGIYQFQKQLSHCENDTEKSKLGYAELERLFSILEKSKSQFPSLTYDIRETTLGEVFLSFQKDS